MEKGFALGPVLHPDGSSIIFSNNDFNNIVSSGANVVRFDLSLFDRAGWDDEIFTLYNEVIDLLNEADIGVIGLLGSGIVPGPHNQQSDWNQNPAERGGSGTNIYVDQFARHAARIVSNIPSVSTWEIWNEPNAWAHHPGDNEYEGGTFIYPSIFATLLRRTYTAIRAARGQRGSNVVTGGLLGHNNRGQTSRENCGADYLDRLYRALKTHSAALQPGIPFDAIGMHFYVDQGGPAAGQAPETYYQKVIDHFHMYLNFVHDVVAAHEGIHAMRRIYVTEVGWRTAAEMPDHSWLQGVTSQVQARNLKDAYDMLRSFPHVAAACWFTLRDNLAADLPYGVLNNNWSRKLSFEVIRGLYL